MVIFQMVRYPFDPNLLSCQYDEAALGSEYFHMSRYANLRQA